MKVLFLVCNRELTGSRHIIDAGPTRRKMQNNSHCSLVESGPWTYNVGYVTLLECLSFTTLIIGPDVARQSAATQSGQYLAEFVESDPAFIHTIAWLKSITTLGSQNSSIRVGVTTAGSKSHGYFSRVHHLRCQSVDGASRQ